VTSVNSLFPDRKNARKRTDRSATLIEESLKRYGAARSIVIDEDNRILAGNGTIDAAKRAGIKNVRIIETDGDEIIAVKRTGLTEDEKIGLALADNRTSDLSEWDQEMLRRLSEEHDISPWFNDEDLNELLAVTELPPEQGKTDPDDVPEPPADPITKPGDLWILGNHRLLCGDSTNPQHVERLMDGKKADMVFSDPPYNVAFSGALSSTSKGGKIVKMSQGYTNPSSTHEEIKNDNMSKAEFGDFMLSVLSVIKTYCVGGYYICFSSATLNELLVPLVQSGLGWKSIIVWNKNQSPMGGGHFRRKYEPIVYGYLENRFYGREYAEDDVWDVDRTRKNDLHPTMKPVELVEKAIGYSSKKGERVMDLFGGSGSTLIACEKTSRHCRMMELDPAYVDCIVKRWEDFTGNTAICHPADSHFDQQKAEF
jgi:DNA modification methylase